MDFSKSKKLLVFLDESGDHSLTKINQDYPIFGLGAVIVDPARYKDIAIGFTEFKLSHLTHDGVILHGSEIAGQDGSFSFLNDKNLREAFYKDLGELVQRSDFKIQAAIINKQRLLNRYTDPINPYSLSLIFVMERILRFAKQNKYDYIDYFVESRGQKENEDLKTVFESFRSNGSSFIDVEDLKNIHHRIEFHNKHRNIVGLQLVDLVIGPITKEVLTGKPHPSCQHFNHKFLKSKQSGVKIFP